MERCLYCGLSGGMMQSVEGGMVHRPSTCLELLKAEIERLQKLLDAAVSLHERRDRITWGWNPDSERFGYYLRRKWAGTMRDVIEAEAAEKAKEE